MGFLLVFEIGFFFVCRRSLIMGGFLENIEFNFFYRIDGDIEVRRGERVSLYCLYFLCY